MRWAPVLGSNIFNVLVILGIAALVTPLMVSRQLIRQEVPAMVAVSFAFYLVAMDGNVARWEGALLFAGIVGYTAWSIVAGRRESSAAATTVIDADVNALDRSGRAMAMDVGRMLVGLGALVLGSNWFVGGATSAAEELGVSDLVFGLTLVAAGTSMPELATSVVASLRGEREIAVGNVVGSNIFNVLSVLGLTAIVGSGGVPVAESALRLDIPVMLGVAVVCLPIFLSGRAIARWEGALLVSLYVGYVAYLYVDATGSDGVAGMAGELLLLAFPVLAVVLGLLAWREQRRVRSVSGERTRAVKDR